MYVGNSYDVEDAAVVALTDMNIKEYKMRY